MNNKKRVLAVLFDIDGTLHDTYEYIVLAFEEVLRLHNQPRKTRKEIDKTVGLSLPDCYKVLAPHGNVELLCQAHHEFQSKNPQLVRAFPNALATLIKLKSLEIKIAAVTARSRLSALPNMDITGIRRFMDIIVTKEDVLNQKPHPESLHTALELLNIKPEEAIMVGDSTVDIQAGRNARVMATIGAIYGFTGTKINKSKPDHVVNDISEILPIIEKYL